MDRGGERVRVGPSSTRREAGGGYVGGSQEESGKLTPRAPSGQSGWDWGGPGWSPRQWMGARPGPGQEQVEHCRVLAWREGVWQCGTELKVVLVFLETSPPLEQC